MEGTLMKSVETFDIIPPLEGATLSNGIILVNIEMIWDMYPDEEKFIKEFGDILTHEMLHNELRKINVSTKFSYGEEKVVRGMLGQKFTPREKRFYNDKKKSNTITYRVK
jgi:hypothetical protein